MVNKYSRGISVIIALGLMVACSAKEEATGPPPTRPVKIFVVEGSTGTTVRNFPGRVDASQRADLAFRVSGQVQEILVKEGDAVALNQTLARLDPTDFKITLDDRQATYDNARRNFERGKELVVKGNISRQDYDRMEAQYRTSLAALSQAKQNMEYTELQAPFAGRVAQRMVEKFEDVLGKQTVFSLQNVDALDISINLPESLVRSLRVSTAPPEELNKTRGAQVVANAVFEGRDTRFVLSVKEIATAADPQTQTFRTTFTMPAPTDFVVLPGMTATVVVDFSRMMEPQVVTWVPVRAVQADSGLTPRVWILNPSTLTVSSREVEIGRMAKGEIEILSGLEGGEEVVAIGAPYLAEGLKVTRMIQTEQAVPRAGDPE